MQTFIFVSETLSNQGCWVHWFEPGLNAVKDLFIACQRQPGWMYYGACELDTSLIAATQIQEDCSIFV